MHLSAVFRHGGGYSSSTHHFHQEFVDSLLSKNKSSGLSSGFPVMLLKFFFGRGPALVFDVDHAQKYDR
jgi:hypothetical protein